MPKFSPIQLSKTENRRGFSFQCPGCNCAHFIQTNLEFSPCWSFNGDIANPTVSPSIRVKGVNLCHSFIKDGKIQFLNDCTHDLAGQTVDLPEWD